MSGFVAFVISRLRGRDDETKEGQAAVPAGPNGAGKSTFAREYLPSDARVGTFVNADLIAARLSPLRPELAAVAAARLVLEHTHPAGQTLIVTEGVGWTQVGGGPKLEFHAGDILWCPAEHKHWHGATPHEGMTHLAIQESVNGTPVTWMEKVSDEEYLAPLAKD